MGKRGKLVSSNSPRLPHVARKNMRYERKGAAARLPATGLTEYSSTARGREGELRVGGSVRVRDDWVRRPRREQIIGDTFNIRDRMLMRGWGLLLSPLYSALLLLILY